ncbi:iron permease FTR1 family-domain-containing protein [Macrophomina phaseolina]|uniref:Iron permease FTR1 family-domain-containing protein n=1 Tax=Macrophomina phaseolina TaxID=35725 RepID=A0ABQ8GVZ3_9PEZI|nr:iron permease FTR1 family-domain-containing protein [Macrophomina phaseolina]
MGAVLLRTRALDAKQAVCGNSTYRVRSERWAVKYAMFLLPFIPVLREGLEAVVYIGCVSLGLPVTAFPRVILPSSGGNSAKLQIFLIISTRFLYLVAAGLFSRAMRYFENNTWHKVIGGDASETGSGPGPYDIQQTERRRWLGTFNVILGWQSSATYDSVLSYNLYRLVVIVAFVWMRYSEQRGKGLKSNATEGNDSASAHFPSSREWDGIMEISVRKDDVGEQPSTKVKELRG